MIFLYRAKYNFNFMDYDDLCTILAVVTMVAAWIPACAGMTKPRDTHAKKSNVAEVSVR